MFLNSNFSIKMNKSPLKTGEYKEQKDLVSLDKCTWISASKFGYWDDLEKTQDFVQKTTEGSYLSFRQAVKVLISEEEYVQWDLPGEDSM